MRWLFPRFGSPESYFWGLGYRSSNTDRLVEEVRCAVLGAIRMARFLDFGSPVRFFAVGAHFVEGRVNCARSSASMGKREEPDRRYVGDPQPATQAERELSQGLRANRYDEPLRLVQERNADGWAVDAIRAAGKELAARRQVCYSFAPPTPTQLHGSESGRKRRG
jgi:hypothetical protein